MLEEIRVCSKCGLDKPIAMFREKRSACRLCENKQRREWGKINHDKIIKNNRKWAALNRDKLVKKVKEWQKKNPDKVRGYSRKPNSVIKKRLRRRIGEAVAEQYSVKAYKTMELLGCSVDECRKWLESKFLPGMTWENYGQYGWHIDHIIPCSAFDLTKPEEQLKCFHYTNLQPLWWEDNLSKSDKIQVITSEGVFLV